MGRRDEDNFPLVLVPNLPDFSRLERVGNRYVTFLLDFLVIRGVKLDLCANLPELLFQFFAGQSVPKAFPRYLTPLFPSTVPEVIPLDVLNGGLLPFHFL